MTMRLFTYLTLDANGEPTAAAEYYNLDLADFDPEMSNNYVIGTARDGTERIVHDSRCHFPIRGSFITAINYLNLQSIGGTTRYFGAVMYRNYSLHLPICLFQEGISGESKKCFVFYLTSCPKDLASLATTVVTMPMNTTRHSHARNMRFNVSITLDGRYTDLNDINSAIWYRAERYG